AVDHQPRSPPTKPGHSPPKGVADTLDGPGSMCVTPLTLGNATLTDALTAASPPFVASAANCGVLPAGAGTGTSVTCEPLTSQICTAPVLLIHSRSLLASPAKLPTPSRCHSVPSSPLRATTLPM